MPAPGDARDAFQLGLEELWTVASSTGRDPESAFESVGLFLERPDRVGPWTYDATPPGARTFASTGGDSVHFSAVGMGDDLVVVMTVPMMFDAPNVVVGRDLVDFLSLGCRFGYFGLEGLAYRPEHTISEIERAAHRSSEGDLAVLEEHLALRPWADVAGRLAELRLLHPAE